MIPLKGAESRTGCAAEYRYPMLTGSPFDYSDPDNDPTVLSAETPRTHGRSKFQQWRSDTWALLAPLEVD
jgi:hypothetical protein